MFRRKKHVPNEPNEAQLAVERAESVIRKVQAQEPEVLQRVNRLQRREVRNNFVASLEKAMRAHDA
jgi:hypothetical protein